MGGASADPLIQARAAGLAHRLLAACGLVPALLGAWLIGVGLVAAEIARVAAVMIFSRRAG